MQRPILILATVFGLTLFVTGAAAQEPTASPATTSTPTTVQPSPEPTTPPIAPTPFPTPGPATNAAITFRLIEDTNGNGVRDDGDMPPSLDTGRPRVFISPWSDPSVLAFMVEMADDGSISMLRIPAGDYSWRLYWPGGFIDPPAADHLPHILRGAFTVHDDGTVSAPAPYPAEWPGLPGERFDPVLDRPVLGPPPEIIFLARKDPGVLAVTTGFLPRISAIGTLDVSSALLGAPPPPIVVPDAGSGDRPPQSEPYTWLLVPFAIALALVTAVTFQLLRRG